MLHLIVYFDIVYKYFTKQIYIFTLRIDYRYIPYN